MLIFGLENFDNEAIKVCISSDVYYNLRFIEDRELRKVEYIAEGIVNDVLFKALS